MYSVTELEPCLIELKFATASYELVVENLLHRALQKESQVGLDCRIPEFLSQVSAFPMTYIWA